MVLRFSIPYLFFLVFTRPARVINAPTISGIIGAPVGCIGMVFALTTVCTGLVVLLDTLMVFEPMLLIMLGPYVVVVIVGSIV